MKRQLSAIGIAFIMFLALCISPAQQASALPKVGNHTLKFNCDVGLYHSTFTFNYSIVLTGTYLPDFNTNEVTYIYNWQLNSATYTGNTPNPVRGPHVEVRTYPTGNPPGGYLNGTVGGATSSTARVFGSGQATAPTATKTNGVAGVTWNPVELRETPTRNPNLDARITWWNQPSCTQYIDLGFPDAPFDGLQSSPTLFCNAGEDFSNSFFMEYDMYNISGPNYSFQIRKLWLDPDLSGDSIAFDLKVIDSNGANINVGPQDPLVPPPLHTWPHMFEQDVDGVYFPGISFNYSPTGDTPYFLFTINMLDLERGSFECSTRIDLAERWLAEDNYFNTETIQFNDCSGEPNAGTLVVTGNWELNSNATKVKLKSVTIFNDSAAQLRLPALSGHNPIFQTGIFGTHEISYMNSNTVSADRNWAAGETKNLNISAVNKWTSIESGLLNGAPRYITVEQPPDIPALSMNFDAFDAIGADCPTGFALEDVTATGEL